MRVKHLTTLILLLFVMVNLTSCAPEGDTSKEYGFFSGLIHGFVFVFALIGKLFGAHVGLYAANNTGFFYWLRRTWGRGAASRR